MRELVNALSRAREQPHVRAAAIVGTERRVLEGGFGERTEAVLRIAQTARQIFRETQPEPRFIDLELSGGRLVLIPAGATLVVIEAELTLEPAALVDALADVLAPLASEASEVTRREARAARPERSVAAAARPSVARALQGLRTAIDAARQHLGALVVRNYLRHERQALLEQEARLGEIDVRLDGTVDASLPEDPRLALAIEAWTTRFLTRACGTAPLVRSALAASTDVAEQARREA